MESELFNRMAALEGVHWWFLGRGEIVRSLVDDERTRRGGNIPLLVDVGPGTGALLGRFGALADEAVGVESDPTALELARSRGLDVRHGVADELPFGDGSVDVVTAFDVLEHLRDDVAAAREFRRVLRPDGTALITVPAYQWLWSSHDDLHHHERRYTRARLVGTLRAAGLEISRSGYFMTAVLPLAVAERVAARVLRRPSRGLDLPPRRVNALLLRLVLSERRRVRSGGFPCGLTVFAVASPGGAPS